MSAISTSQASRALANCRSKRWPGSKSSTSMKGFDLLGGQPIADTTRVPRNIIAAVADENLGWHRITARGNSACGPQSAIGWLGSGAQPELMSKYLSLFGLG
jgi:hypothetical protein